MSYHDDLQYAKDIMRIRNALLSGELNEGHGVHYGLTNSIYGKGRIFHIFKDGARRVIGDITQKDDYENTGSIITDKSLVHITSLSRVVDTTVFDKQHCVYHLLPGYDEAQHFQDTMLYSLEQVRSKTVMNHLHTEAMPKFNRFKLFWCYVPILLAKLDGTDDSI
jgi:hypothetical protein